MAVTRLREHVGGGMDAAQREGSSSQLHAGSRLSSSLRQAHTE
ncbi:hypothetical protein [Nonomuraea recticatena]